MKLIQDATEVREVVSRAAYAALLIPSPRREYVEQVCAQAKQYGFACVLATPFDCCRVLELLDGSGVETVCMNALNHALDENIDCRIQGLQTLLGIGVRRFALSVPCGDLLDEKYDAVTGELTSMLEAIHAAGGKASVILEPECMSETAMARIIDGAVTAGADAIRICSGFATVCGTEGGRATLHNICLVRELCAGRISLLAGGGWDYAYLEDCAEYLSNGAVQVDVGPRFVQQLEELGYRKEAVV